MIVSQKKPIEEVMGMLSGVKKVALVGCKSCATACGVGGEKECSEMKAYLEEQGIEVVGIVLPDESCHKMLVKKEIKARNLCSGVHIMAIGAEKNVPVILEKAGSLQ